MSKPHNLPPGIVPAIKLDSAGAAALSEGITDAQARDLFATLTSGTMLIVEVRSIARDEDVDNEKRPAAVKLRIVGAEAAFDRVEADALRRTMRAMFRRRQMAGTIDELGDGPEEPAEILDDAFEDHPTEAEYREFRKPSPVRVHG